MTFDDTSSAVPRSGDILLGAEYACDISAKRPQKHIREIKTGDIVFVLDVLHREINHEMIVVHLGVIKTLIFTSSILDDPIRFERFLKFIET